MKKIKEFFLGIFSLGVLVLLVDNFKIIVTVVLVVAAFFLIIRLALFMVTHLGKAADKSKDPPPAEQKPEISVTWESPEPLKAPVRFSSSTDKEDYDYAYSHVGLFRPKDTPGAVPPVGTDVFFLEEPDNPYDADAVKAVWYCNGEEQLVGYFYRSDEAIRGMVRDWLHREHEYYAVITENSDKPRLFIGFNR